MSSQRQYQQVVAVDAQTMLGNRTGVGHYTYHLVRTAAKLRPSTEFRLVVFSWRGRSASLLKLQAELKDLPNITFRVVTWLPGRVFFALQRRGWLPKLDFLVRGADVVLFPNFTVWPLSPGKYIAIIYDLSYLLYPEYFGAQHSAFLTKLVPQAIKTSERVITISENSQAEIVEHYKDATEKLVLIYPAVDRQNFKPATAVHIAKARRRYSLPECYILSVSTIEPRKNLVTAMRAYIALPEDLRKQYPLVLTGGKGWVDDDIRTLHAELSNQNQIIMTGYVADEDLPAVFSGASLFIYPSLYEGFGMPPLEAMSSGTPVITGDNSSLPEVVGRAAVLINAQKTMELTAAMEQILSSSSLAKQLKAKGLKQAAKFSWEASARKLLKTIDDVL